MGYLWAFTTTYLNLGVRAAKGVVPDDEGNSTKLSQWHAVIVHRHFDRLPFGASPDGGSLKEMWEQVHLLCCALLDREGAVTDNDVLVSICSEVWLSSRVFEL